MYIVLCTVNQSADAASVLSLPGAVLKTYVWLLFFELHLTLIAANVIDGTNEDCAKPSLSPDCHKIDQVRADR